MRESKGEGERRAGGRRKRREGERREGKGKGKEERRGAVVHNSFFSEMCAARLALMTPPKPKVGHRNEPNTGPQATRRVVKGHPLDNLRHPRVLRGHGQVASKATEAGVSVIKRHLNGVWRNRYGGEAARKGKQTPTVG